MGRIAGIPYYYTLSMLYELSINEHGHRPAAFVLDVCPNVIKITFPRLRLWLHSKNKASSSSVPWYGFRYSISSIDLAAKVICSKLKFQYLISEMRKGKEGDCKSCRTCWRRWRQVFVLLVQLRPRYPIQRRRVLVMRRDSICLLTQVPFGDVSLCAHADLAPNKDHVDNHKPRGCGISCSSSPVTVKIESQR